MGVCFLEAASRQCVLPTHSGQTTFFKPVSRPNPDLADWSATKQPLATSPNRPGAARRGLRPIRTTEVSSRLAQWPVSGERIAGGTASTRPVSDSQRCSAVDAPTAVVFQIPDNCTLPFVWSDDRSTFPCPLNPIVKAPTCRHRLRR